MSSTRTAALWHFDEPDGVLPSDAAGNVSDLVAPATMTAPARATGIVGYGRVWAGGTGLKGTELVVDALKLRRTMAIEALFFANGDGTHILAQRGANTGTAAERIVWGLKVTTAGQAFTLQMFWQKSSGAATVPGMTFTRATDWLYLAAVRRWISAASVAVDYYANGELIGTQTSTDGDIDGGDGGTILIGVADGAGTPTTGLIAGDIIDELRISADERTAEEIRQTFRRLFYYPQLGGELLRAFLPPGQAYSRDPSSVVQRELAIEGDALANVMSLAAVLEEDALPDRATQTLDHWEDVTRLQPQPGDDYATRRTRVVAHRKKIHGYSRQKIAEAVAPLLGTVAANVTFREFSNRWAEPFDTALGTIWTSITGNATAPAVGSGKLTLAFAAGNDCRWTGAVDGATRILRGLEQQDQTEIYVKVSTVSLANSGDKAGIILAASIGTTVDHHILGVTWTGAALAFTHEKVVSGVVTTANFGAPPATPFILRVRMSGADAELSYGSTFDGPWTVVATVPTIAIVDAVGVGLTSSGAAPASPGSIAFDDVRAWMPQSRNVYFWIVNTAPPLASTFNVRAAQALIDAMKPAHTQGIVAGALFLYDDPLSLMDTSTVYGS